MKRARALLLVSFVLLSAVAGPATGTVAAQTQTETVTECAGWVEGLGDAVPFFDPYCNEEEITADTTSEDLVDTWFAVDGEIQEINNAQSDLNNTNTYFKHYLREEVQTYFAQQVANESVGNVVEAEQNTVDHLKDIAAQHQRTQIIAENERYISNLYAEVVEANNVTDGVPQSTNIYNDDGTSTLAYANTTKQDVQLANGEYTNYSMLITNDASSRPHAALTIDTGTTSMKDLVHTSHSTDTENLEQIRVSSGKLNQRFTEVETAVSNEISNLDTLANNINDSTFDGLNESDILTPTQAAEKYGSEGGAGWASVVASTISDTSYNYEGEAVLNVDGTNYTGIVGMNNPLISDVDGSSEYDATLTEDETLDLGIRNGTLYMTLTDGSNEVKTWDSQNVEVLEVTAENQTTLGFNADNLESYNVSLADEYVTRYAEIRENASVWNDVGEDCGILCFGSGLDEGDGTVVFVLMLLGGIVLSLIVIVGIVYLARSE